MGRIREVLDKVRRIDIQGPDVEEFVEAIEKTAKAMGLYIYENPRAEGSDTYAYIVSKKKLKPADVTKLSNAKKAPAGTLFVWWDWKDYDEAEASLNKMAKLAGKKINVEERYIEIK